MIILLCFAYWIPLIFNRMQKVTDPEKAAVAYLEYLQEMQANGVNDRDEEGRAHLFLANYNLNKKDHDVAYKHAFKCLEYPEVICWLLNPKIGQNYSWSNLLMGTISRIV